MKKIVLLCVTSQSVLTFRKGLIKKLKEENYHVSVVAFDELHRSEVEALGVDFYCIEDKNRSINPLRLFSLKGKYKKLLKQLQPDVVFTFMLKPNVFGPGAAKAAGVKNIYSMVEGAGDVFINKGLLWKVARRILCFMYNRAFKHCKKVFFLNEEDKHDFISRWVLKDDKCEIVRGVGVDLEYFDYRPMQTDRTFLMMARMLKNKGVLEYCKCARAVKQKYPDAVFNYLGAECNITVDKLKEYIDDGSICYLGTAQDVRPYIEACTVNVLPSHREGLGLVNAEAGAMGRPSITCDTIGTKDTVEDGYNGFLVDVKNVEQMAEKCIWMIEHPEETVQMGKNARAFAEEHFNSVNINQRIYDILRDTVEE